MRQVPLQNVTLVHDVPAAGVDIAASYLRPFGRFDWVPTPRRIMASAGVSGILAPAASSGSGQHPDPHRRMCIGGRRCRYSVLSRVVLQGDARSSTFTRTSSNVPRRESTCIQKHLRHQNLALSPEKLDLSSERSVICLSHKNRVIFISFFSVINKTIPGCVKGTPRRIHREQKIERKNKLTTNRKITKIRHRKKQGNMTKIIMNKKKINK